MFFFFCFSDGDPVAVIEPYLHFTVTLRTKLTDPGPRKTITPPPPLETGVQPQTAAAETQTFAEPASLKLNKSVRLLPLRGNSDLGLRQTAYS